MNTQHLHNIIKQGEGLTVEFKKSKTKLNNDLFESVCALLNRCGGHIFLGVEDNGAITGVDPDKVQKLVTDFSNSCNDPDKLFPTIYLTPQVVTIEDKTVIYIYVPESSQVHNTAGKVFDRNNDGDYNVTRKSDQLAALYQRKQTEYSENRMFPYATMDDIRSDPFYLEGDQRVNVRNRLFREPIANILIHREYANAYPAKMVIEKNRVQFENANRPHGHGIIDPENFVPFPKNHVIAKVFREIGYVEELGSGVRNMYRYTPVYTKGASPQLIEDDIFRIIIPLTEQSGGQAGGQVGGQVNVTQRQQDVLEIIKHKPSVSRTELAQLLDINPSAVQKHLDALKEKGLILRVGKTTGHWEVIE